MATFDGLVSEEPEFMVTYSEKLLAVELVGDIKAVPYLK